MSEEKNKEQLLQEEREDQETLVNLAATYHELDVESGIKGRTSTKVKIYRPTMAHRAEADRFAKAQFIKCIQDGIPTRHQAMKVSREAGLWNSDMEERMTTISTDIESYVADQNDTENKAKKERLRTKIRKLKAEQLELASVFTEITRNTIEQVQDDAQQSILIIRNVFTFGKKNEEVLLYDTMDKLNSETDIKFIERLTNACSAFWLGDSVSDFFALGELLEDQTSEQDTESPKS